ncbi:type IV pilus modification PilV family protein [Streptococcus oricebi]|nr:prepilin-type N-terminal cleavage/methylation domain-containing protein [Streptococcus oricebi]
MKKRKGFSLTEVVISLILIATVVMALLTFFSDGFSNIFQLRKQNAINFKIQEKFETDLARIKKDGGTGTEIERFNYKVGNSSYSVDVKGETFSYDDNVKKMRLFVANQKESVLEIPKELDVQIPNSKRYYYLGDKIPDGLAELKEKDKSNVRIDVESTWFLSHRDIESEGKDIVTVGSQGFVTPFATSRLVLPDLLKDFSVKSSSNSGFTVTNNMLGRYLTFAGRAINSYGRVGNYQEADHRIWVMGMPVVKNLKLHTDLDLALYKNNDGTKGAIPTNNQAYTNVEVMDYKHDKIYGGGIPVESVYEEKLKQTRQLMELGDKPIHFSGQNFASGMTTSVLIANRVQTGSLLTYKMDNTMTWSIDLTREGKLNLKTVDTTGLNTEGQVVVPTNISYDQDNAIQVRSSKDNTNVKLEIFINGTLAHTQNLKLSGRAGNKNVTHNVNAGIVYFSGNTYINEFAIHEDALTDTNIKAVADYFANKYQAK